MSDAIHDVWSEWLLHRRHAGDPEFGARVRSAVQGYEDKVLDAARLAPGMTLLDVGAGEGLLALRAIERVGPSLRAILTDISAPMLKHAAATAEHRQVSGQCTFIECSAERLLGVGDACIDAAVTRASLAYVADKQAAFRELHRVLKPGGRLSIAEPILQDEAFAARALKQRVAADSGGAADRFLEFLHRWKSAQFPDSEAAYALSPHVNYSERDLINLARAAGFGAIHMELHIDLAPSLATSWDVFLGASPHPWAPTLGSILAEKFSAEERQAFEQLVRPTVESGRNLSIDRIAYLQATKEFADADGGTDAGAGDGR